MLSAKQDGIKYRFLSLWYDSTRDWTLVSRTIGEHSTHSTNGPVKSKQNYPTYFFVKGILALGEMFIIV